MANVLKLKRSAVARRIPGPADLTLGELALNTWDGRLFGKKNDGADAIVEFLSSDGAFKPDVRAATLANITLAGVQTVDSVVLAAGDRVLVRSQSTAAQNGVYIVSASTWSRATDADSGAKLAGALVPVSEGSASAGLGWSVSYNGTVGGVNCSTAMATTYGNVGAARISYAGSNNGGLAVCSFGPR